MYIYAKYSKLDPSYREFIHKKLLKFLVPKLRFVYPGFRHWLQTKIFDSYGYPLMPHREVIICSSGGKIVGVAILKKATTERKICCLYVDKRFRYSCIGSELLQKSFEYLETTKPLITVQYKEYKQFASLFKDNKFELTNVNKVKFKPFFKELEFNGNCLFHDYPLRKTIHIDECNNEVPYVFLYPQKQNLVSDGNNCWQWLDKNPIRDLYWFRSPQPAIGYYGYGPFNYQRCWPFDPFAPYNYYLNGGICKMERKTLVISAFPACGKTFYTKSVGGTGKIVLDSDSSEYSWINSTRETTSKEYEEHRCMYVNDVGKEPIFMDQKRIRNPKFPANYIKHIKENIGKADIIFVSSHIAVRQALTDAGIDYITIYPTKKCKAEWIGRMYLRGNDKAFIDMQVEHWDEWIDAVEKEPHGKFVVYLNPWHFINDYVLDKIMGVMKNETNLANVDKIVFGEFKEPNAYN